MTSPAIQILKMGIVLYSELSLATIGQLKIVGGDQTPTECKNEKEVRWRADPCG